MGKCICFALVCLGLLGLIECIPFSPLSERVLLRQVQHDIVEPLIRIPLRMIPVLSGQDNYEHSEDDEDFEKLIEHLVHSNNPMDLVSGMTSKLPGGQQLPFDDISKLARDSVPIESFHPEDLTHIVGAESFQKMPIGKVVNFVKNGASVEMIEGATKITKGVVPIESFNPEDLTHIAGSESFQKIPIGKVIDLVKNGAPVELIEGATKLTKGVVPIESFVPEDVTNISGSKTIDEVVDLVKGGAPVDLVQGSPVELINGGIDKFVSRKRRESRIPATKVVNTEPYVEARYRVDIEPQDFHHSSARFVNGNNDIIVSDPEALEQDNDRPILIYVKRCNKINIDSSDNENSEY